MSGERQGKCLADRAAAAGSKAQRLRLAVTVPLIANRRRGGTARMARATREWHHWYGPRELSGNGPRELTRLT